MSFAERLRCSRREKGFSQEQLAETVDVSRQSITKWETGAAYPELKKLILLSISLDKDLDWLLYDERSELYSSRELEMENISFCGRIHDMRSLRSAMKEIMVRRILEALEGVEFIEEAKEEEFKERRTYTVFESRMFLTVSRTDPETGDEKEFFSEPDTAETIDVLARYLQRLKYEG